MAFITASILLVLIHFVYCQENVNNFPPLLNISKPHVDVPPNTSLTIECRGRREVMWHYKTIESWKSKENVSSRVNTTEDTKGKIYIVLLYLPPSYVFTGLYTCSYKNIINNGHQRNVSVYVFMNDPHHLFVPQSEFNTTSYSPLNAENHLYVPCLPTNSKINVTLWQYTDIPNELKYLPTNDMIAFDPKNGYLIREPLSRNLTCRAHWNSFQESTSIFRIQVPNDFITKPFIERTSFYWNVGDNNYLNCSVAVASSVNFQFNWTHPNIKDNDMDVSEGYLQLESRDGYDFLFRILNVTSVQTSHEGFYACSLKQSDGNNRTEVSEDRVYISVHADKPVEPVRFERAVDIPSPITEMPGKSITFSVNVTNYYLEEIEIQWEKDGLLIQESSKYKFDAHSLSVSLSINNLEMSDAGKYILIGRRIYQYTTSNVSFLLAIKSVPSVEILQPFYDRFYEVNNTYELKCQAKSYSRSNITWIWKECNSWDLCDSRSKVAVTNGIGSIAEENLENSMFLTSSILTIKAYKSGIYYCKAVNSIDANETFVPFIVTDIPEGQPLLLIANDRTPSAKSDVKIKCEITSMIYENITWSFIEVPGNYSMLDISDVSEFNKSTEKRVYSEISILSFKARKSRSGLYGCTFIDKRGNNLTDKFVGIYINEPEATIQPSSIPPSGPGNMESNTVLTPTTVTIISIVVVAALLIIITIIAVAVKIRRKNLRFDARNFQTGQVGLINPDLPIEDQVELLPYDPRWEFPKDRLKLGRVIGHGAFGRVVKADAIGLENNIPYTTVAVKMLKDRNDEIQYKSLMAELKIMIHLGRHVNILNLMGAVTKSLYKGELMVMVEYCCHGNLRSYLLKHREKFINQINPETGKVDQDILFETTIESAEENRQRFDYSKPIALGISNPSYNYSSTGQLIKSSVSSHVDVTGDTSAGTSTLGGETSIGTVGGSESGYSSTGETLNFPCSGKEAARYSGILTTSDLLCYCFQCAQGMSYLASRKLLHRDLAARNILLAEGNVIKISDFGLSKDVYKYSKYVKKADGPLPVKWMAIESIRDRIFTIQSDVWSFGILMWEIFTLGGNPYPGFEMNEGFFKRLQEGYRLEKPEYSPADVYQIMLDCWQSNPKDRPDFSYLAEQIGDMLEATVKVHYINLNGPYSLLNNDLRSLEDYLNMNNTNYLDMTPSLQETNVDNVPDYMSATGLNSTQEKSPYYNIPPTIEEHVASEQMQDLKNEGTGTDLPVQMDSTEIDSETKNKDTLCKENLLIHSNSSISIESETGESRTDKAQTKNPDYLVMT